MQNTLVLGIGNTLLSDEGLGIHLLNLLRREPVALEGVSYLDGGTLSFTLAPAIEDCDNLVVLDAAQMNAAPGTIELFINEDMDRFIGQGRRSVHEVGLVDLLNIARLQHCLPERRALLGIQPAAFGWGEAPSETVAAALPEAAERVRQLLYRWQKQAKL
jgi:hydrogenase maturation protease